MTPAPPRRGRRPGASDTRETILVAAREMFAAHGYERASVRAIATHAAVDPALVYHYFGSKQKLFLAAMNIPVDPDTMAQAILDGPRTEIGARLVRYVLGFWDSPTGNAALALLQSSANNEWTVRLMGEFVSTQILHRVATGIGIDQEQIPVRIGLVITQIMGLAMARHIIRFEPLASATPEQLTTAISPTVQRYLTGDLPTADRGTDRQR
jgi:AcrR family transcriptional regulator